MSSLRLILVTRLTMFSGIAVAFGIAWLVGLVWLPARIPVFLVLSLFWLWIGWQYAKALVLEEEANRAARLVPTIPQQPINDPSTPR